MPLCLLLRLRLRPAAAVAVVEVVDAAERAVPEREPLPAERARLHRARRRPAVAADVAVEGVAAAALLRAKLPERAVVELEAVVEAADGATELLQRQRLLLPNH
jgi:hypothetical protein